jgi:tetratricopeptide (TPR) repeat protein
MYETAIGYLEKAINLYPKATNGYILYGNALAVHRKDLKGAVEQYLKVLSYAPFETNAYNNALKVLNSVDNSKETDYKLEVYTRLFSINPENSEVNYYLGKLNGQFKGNLDTSAYFLERTLRFTPDNVAAYKDLGIVYSLSGKYTEALAVFSRALKLAPDDQMLRQNYLISRQAMQSNPKK